MIGKKLYNYLMDYIYGIESEKYKDNSQKGNSYYDYEPSDYSILKYILKKYPLDKDSHFLDVGAGKGRAMILALLMGAGKVTGLEIDCDLYNDGLNNIKTIERKYPAIRNRYKILNVDALKYNIEKDINYVFFFNPFDYMTFNKMLLKILENYKENPRIITLFFAGNRKNAEECVDGIGEFCWVEKRKNIAVCVIDK